MFYAVECFFPKQRRQWSARKERLSCSKNKNFNYRGLIDLAARNRIDVKITVAHRMYSIVVYRVTSQSYGRDWSVAEIDKLRRNVCADNHKVVSMFSLVCTFGLFTLKFFFRPSDKDILGIEIYLRWMRRYSNNLRQLSNLHTITRLNDLRRIWLRWCMVWIESESMQPERRRTEETFFCKRF